jgi:LacI family transcriptional regulator
MSPRRDGGRPTIKDVAVRAGVALSSVSRVLNDHPAVSEDLRRRVLAAVSEMKFEPDLTAMSLRTGATMTVGFVVRDIATPVFADMVKAAEAALSAKGYSMLLTSSDGNPDRDATYLRLFAQRRVDALLLSLSSETHRATIEALQSWQPALVLIDRTLADIEANAVLSDHYSGVRAATRHLADLGHRRIGIITGPQHVLASRERIRGYKAGLRSAGIKFDPALSRPGSYHQEFGIDQTRELLDLDQPATAVIAGGAMINYGVLRVVRERRLSLPGDLALVGCDSWRQPELFEPSLTVVSRDAELMGRTAAELVLDAISGGPARRVTLPTELVIGRTTDPNAEG